ncbi:MAG: hypothetical protein BAJATHORv1_10085 [Candidatus Thorarchaeota archaeon]|nr:MAG: hypothetical protein BAJATHORv1_10085 [Candidatus Thorarchaeota archaeon]
MQPGKVPPDILAKYVFSHLGKSNSSVILGPGLGEDASLIKIGDHVLVAATDPITGSISDIGWLAVHINANDIATFGVPPSWFLSSILLPYGTDEHTLVRIMKQIDSAANSLDIAVVGGHTEVTEGINRPIIAGFMMGITKKDQYVTTAGAKIGDELLLTKYAGLEGTAIIATEGESYLESQLDKQLVEDAKALKEQISVVKEGVHAFQTGYVSAMHDPTEGGIANGIHEICDASELGVVIDAKSIPIHPSTIEICRLLDIEALHLISSGCMLISCEKGTAEDVLDALKSVNISSTKIGHFTKKENKRVILRNGQKELLPRPTNDALWNALRSISQGNL